MTATETRNRKAGRRNAARFFRLHKILETFCITTILGDNMEAYKSKQNHSSDEERKIRMMGSMKKIIAFLLIILWIHSYLPRVGFTQSPAAQNNPASSVESVSTPEAEITESGSDFRWWIIVLGVVLIGAAAAMAGGGSGGTSTTPATTSPPPSNNTGSVAVKW